MRPSLGKKGFPVCRVASKNASCEVGIFFSSNFTFFYTLECTGGGGVKKKEKIENMKKKKKKVPYGPFPPGRWTGNNFLFKGCLTSGVEV